MSSESFPSTIRPSRKRSSSHGSLGPFEIAGATNPTSPPQSFVSTISSVKESLDMDYKGKEKEDPQELETAFAGVDPTHSSTYNSPFVPSSYKKEKLEGPRGAQDSSSEVQDRQADSIQVDLEGDSLSEGVDIRLEQVINGSNYLRTLLPTPSDLDSNPNAPSSSVPVAEDEVRRRRKALKFYVGEDQLVVSSLPDSNVQSASSSRWRHLPCKPATLQWNDDSTANNSEKSATGPQYENDVFWSTPVETAPNHLLRKREDNSGNSRAKERFSATFPPLQTKEEKELADALAASLKTYQDPNLPKDYDEDIALAAALAESDKLITRTNKVAQPSSEKLAAELNAFLLAWYAEKGWKPSFALSKILLGEKEGKGLLKGAGWEAHHGKLRIRKIGEEGSFATDAVEAEQTSETLNTLNILLTYLALQKVAADSSFSTLTDDFSSLLATSYSNAHQAIALANPNNPFEFDQFDPITDTVLGFEERCRIWSRRLGEELDLWENSNKRKAARADREAQGSKTDKEEVVKHKKFLDFTWSGWNEDGYEEESEDDDDWDACQSSESEEDSEMEDDGEHFLVV